MGIVLGFVCFLLFLLLCAKALTRKLHLTKANAFLLKIHKPVCVLLVILCACHFILVLPVLDTRYKVLTISGICAIIFMVLLIVLGHKIKTPAKRLRYHRIFSCLMGLTIIGHIVICQMDFTNYLNQLSDISIEDIDFSTIADGTYIGSYDIGYINAKVEVTMKDGVMTDVKLLEHNHERGKAAEGILPAILQNQTLATDSVSSATNSSMVIKAAIQDALLHSQTR